MDFVYLKTLLEASLLGSFSKAAISLCVTQSAVSRRIKYLEDHYGQQLLDRSGTVLKPTRAGALLIEKAQKVLAIEKEILAGLQELQTNRKISFCCTRPFGMVYLPEILQEFMARNPDNSDLNFVFEAPEKTLDGLRENVFDLAVIEHYNGLNLEEFPSFPLPKDEMVFVSAPGLGIESPVVDIDLLIPMRRYCKKDNCCAKLFLDINMRSIGRDSNEFRNAVFFDDIPFIIREVSAGNGITFISRTIVSKHLEEGTLRMHYVNGFNHARPRVLVLNPLRKPDPMLLDFIKGIYQAFGLVLPETLYPSP